MSGHFVISTTPLGLARELWRFGEDDLWPRARELPAREVALVGIRAGHLSDTQTYVEQWGRPYSASVALVLASIEKLDHPRMPVRRRRRSEKLIPAVLVASEDELWSDPQLQEVSKEMKALIDKADAGWRRVLGVVGAGGAARRAGLARRWPR